MEFRNYKMEEDIFLRANYRADCRVCRIKVQHALQYVGNNTVSIRTVHRLGCDLVTTKVP